MCKVPLSIAGKRFMSVNSSYSAASSTIDPQEIEKFSRMAATWWDPTGPMKVLHKFNPVRLAYIREKLCTHFERDSHALDALSGLSLIDIGCGAGLLSEPLARMGASVTGIDASSKNIAIAKTHAVEHQIKIDYREEPVEALAARGELYDVVLVMEVVEHVADLDAFLKACCSVLKPNGLIFIATLNRTLRSFVFAIVGAEYVLGWLPKGTHEWRKFVTPQETQQKLTDSEIRLLDEQGVVYNPLKDQWQLSRDMAVNYMVLGHKSV
jgi:2-polyprenyl-6-hydroxyphenyl methylase / 3-demethylubiquinone-9 3-methyltransferase